MRIAVALKELAESSTRDAVLIGTVHHDLVLRIERMQRLPHRGEMYGTRYMLCLVGPLTEGHHQAEIILAVQFLLQLLVTNGSHCAFLSSASRSHRASRAPARRCSGKTPAAPAQARKRCARLHSAGGILPARDCRR